MARGARNRALDAFLHRLRPHPAKEILRLLPEGHEERLGPAAARAMAVSPRGPFRGAARKRVADRAHGPGGVPTRPGRLRARLGIALEGSTGSQSRVPG